MAEKDVVYHFPLSRSRVRQGFVVGGFLIFVGIYAAFFGPETDDYSNWIALVLVGLGLAAAVHAFRQRHDSSPKLVIDERGIWYFEWEISAVPWEQIARVYQKGIRLRGFVVVELLDQPAYFGSLPTAERQRIKFGKLIKPGYLLIPQGGVEASLGEIETAIQAAGEHFGGGAEA